VLLRIVLIVALLLAAVLGLAALKPKTMQLQRSIVIHAPAEKIFALLDDFHNWRAWAPGDKDDPSIQRSYSGAPSGVGTASDWQGRGSTGAGHMAITGAVPPSRLTVTVDFTRPFVAHNINTFTLETVAPEPGAAAAPASAESTKVTWSFEGTNVFMLRVMSIFMNMDHFMGQHFEQGLQSLKIATEK
jgi:uncharacterized protein YndB with AHSA1/START domain